MNWINRCNLETVLLKAVLVACHKTTDVEATAVEVTETLCRVSRMWRDVMMNCPSRKKVAFQQCIDSKFIFFLFYPTVSSLIV